MVERICQARRVGRDDPCDEPRPVVAELGSLRETRSPVLADAFLSDAVRSGVLTPPVLARALDAFPGPLRTLGAQNLASCAYLVENGQPVTLASFDLRMTAVARVMDIPLFELDGSEDA